MIELENICVANSGGPILNGVSVHVKASEHVVVCGPSGAGKTTLLRIIAGLESLTEGIVRIGGKDAADKAQVNLAPHQRGIGMVFQDHSLWPHLSVGGNVALALPWQWRGRSAKVGETLKACSLDGFANRRISSLSGGELQRASLACAIINKPKILLLDEPFTGLDLETKEQLASLLCSMLMSTGTTAITVTHDPFDAVSLKPDRIIVLERGRIEDDMPLIALSSAQPRSALLRQWMGRLQSIAGV